MSKKNLKEVILFMIASGLEFFAWGFVEGFFSIFVKDILNNFFLIGLAFATQSLFILIATIVTSEITDEIKARNLAIFGKFLMIFTSISYFAAGVYQSSTLLLIGMTITGIGVGIRTTSEQDFLIEHANSKNASKILGIGFASKNSAMTVTIMISGFLLFYLGQYFKKDPSEIIHYLFLPCAPLFIAAIIILLMINKERMNLKKAEKVLFHGHIFKKFFQGIGSFTPQLNFSLSVSFIIILLRKMTLIFVPLLAVKLSLGVIETGILISLLMFPFMFSFLFSFLADKFDRLWIVIIGLFISIIPLVFLSITSSPLYIAVLSGVLSFSVAMIQPANLGIIATLVPEKEKAHIAGLETFLGYMGSIFGALVLGYIAEKYSLNAVFVIMAIIAGGFFITACIIKYKFDIQHKKIANHHHHFIHHAHAK